MKYLITLALLVTTLQAETICNKKTTTPEGYDVYITCMDWPKIAETNPVPWGTEAATQVLAIDRKGKGTIVRVKLGGKVLFADMLASPGNITAGGVSFNGMDYTVMPEITVTGPIQ